MNQIENGKKHENWLQFTHRYFWMYVRFIPFPTLSFLCFAFHALQIVFRCRAWTLGN